MVRFLAALVIIINTEVDLFRSASQARITGARHCFFYHNLIKHLQIRMLNAHSIFLRAHHQCGGRVWL
jgi:hypothetical protein